MEVTLGSSDVNVTMLKVGWYLIDNLEIDQPLPTILQEYQSDTILL
jgi:hypothetical protein